MAYDEVEITILPDGTIRSENGKISAPNHSSCSQFFNLLGELSGGKVERLKKQPGHVHVHDKIAEKE